jgi:hypothetical protein
VPGPALVGCMWNYVCRMRITGLTVRENQCFGSGSALDPHSIGVRIRIRIRNADPDPGVKLAEIEEKTKLIDVDFL